MTGSEDTAAPVTAAMLVIGDEILSGRTKDKNIGYVAEYLTGLGIDLREARVVPDDIEEIAAAVNALRARYDYVFTSGGIGPTHDDITADAVGHAFGLKVDHNPEAVEILRAYMGDRLNEARLRMARTPEGAELVRNPVSNAPGFRVGNVFVMAGIPAVMQGMMDEIAPLLRKGQPYFVELVEGEGVKEGDIGGPLGEVQKDFPGVIIGSYPHSRDGRLTTTIVLRSRSEADLAAARARVMSLVDEMSR